MTNRTSLAAVVTASLLSIGCMDADSREIHRLAALGHPVEDLAQKSVQLYTFGSVHIDHGLEVATTGQNTRSAQIRQSYQPPAWLPTANADYALSGYVQCRKEDGGERVVDITIGSVTLAGASSRVDAVDCDADEVAFDLRVNVDYRHIVGAINTVPGTVANALMESPGPIGTLPEVTILDMAAGRAIMKAYTKYIDVTFNPTENGTKVRFAPYLYCGDDYWWNEYAFTTVTGQPQSAQLDCTPFGVDPVRYGMQITLPEIDLISAS